MPEAIHRDPSAGESAPAGLRGEVQGSRLRATRWLGDAVRSHIFLTLVIAIYVACFLAIALPVLTYPVQADDGYWILNEPTAVNNSILQAYTQSLAEAFTFEGQPRTTALATGERRALAIVAMNFATTFTVPPWVPWALFKVMWLLVNISALALFVIRLTYRDSLGVTRGLSRTSILSIVILFPVVLAAGIEMETVLLNNGWIFYPNLTYLPFGVYLLVATLLLALEGPVRRSPLLWGPPSFLLLGGIALAISLQYELMALAIPVGILALVLKPVDGDSWLSRWRGKLFLGGVFGGVYTLIFLWTRWQISQMACHANGTCYQGNVIQIDPGAIVRNITASLPGPGIQAAFDAGPDALGSRVFWASVIIGVIASLTAATTLFLLLQRGKPEREISAPLVRPANIDTDRRGLFVVVMLMLVIVVGSAIITGITERAVERLVEPISPYRVGVIIWSAMSVALIALGLCGLSLIRNRARAARLLVVPMVIAVALVGVVAGASLWNNLLINEERLRAPTQKALSEIHWQVALGDASAAGDTARCELLDRYWATYDNPSNSARLVVRGAQRAFQLHHGQPFCSRGTPEAGPSSGADSKADASLIPGDKESASFYG